MSRERTHSSCAPFTTQRHSDTRPFCACLRAGCHRRVCDFALVVSFAKCRLELSGVCVVGQVQSQKGKRMAGLEAQDSRGNTPLHCAARNGHLDCVQLLLDAGVEAIDTHQQLLNDRPLGRTVSKDDSHFVVAEESLMFLHGCICRSGRDAAHASLRTAAEERRGCPVAAQA